MNQIADIIDQMKTSRVRNYAVAGLDSFLISNGVVRLFECSRDHQDQITPHSHRFDFACIVLAGSVTNRLWEECAECDGDLFQRSKLKYSGDIGQHRVLPERHGWWCYTDQTYTVGECYSMTAEQVHSIQFSRGARVLFLEGPQKTDESFIIEPLVGGEVIPTYKKSDYMFKRD